MVARDDAVKTLIPNLRMHWPYFDRAELFKIVSSRVEYLAKQEIEVMTDDVEFAIHSSR